MINTSSLMILHPTRTCRRPACRRLGTSISGWPGASAPHQKHNIIVSNVWILLLMLLVPVAGRAENPSTFLKNTLDDGLSLYSSPFRLQKEDAPVALAVAGILGGSVALDRITRRNLLPYQDTGSASTLRTYGDVAQFSGPILGGAFAVSAWMTHDDYEMSASWGLSKAFSGPTPFPKRSRSLWAAAGRTPPMILLSSGPAAQAAVFPPAIRFRRLRRRRHSPSITPAGR